MSLLAELSEVDVASLVRSVAVVDEELTIFDDVELLDEPNDQRLNKDDWFLVDCAKHNDELALN